MFKKYLNVKTFVFIILLIFLLYLMPKLSGLLMLLFASFVFAAALNPFVNKLEERIKNRAVSSTIVVCSSILFLLALIFPIFIMCYKELVLLISILPQKFNNFYNFIVHFKLYGKTLGEIIPVDNLAGASTNLAQNVFSQSINITMATFQAVFIALALTMFVYYILVDKTYLNDKFLEFFPPNLREKARNILYNITSKVGNYVRAQALSMITVGLMVTIMIAILQIDYPILLGLVSGICEIIPLLGPSIAIGVIIAIAFPLGITRIVIAIVLFLVIQQVSNYIIRPFLFGKFMKLHPITILVAVFVAEEFLGVWGVILSPAIAATICVLIDELYLSTLNAKELETKE